MPLVDDRGSVRFAFKEEIMAKKTTCPVSRTQFRTKARPVSVAINGVPLMAEVKEFSTGSLGWYLNGKTTIDVGGTQVAVQIGMNLTIVGSKELPQEGGASTPITEVA
jgi:acyl CoA:acetate/3-ketoacid CoA transferase beta subunit